MLPSKSATGKTANDPLPQGAGAALALTVLWLLLAVLLLFLFGTGGVNGGLGFLLIALVIVLPVAMIWVVHMVLHSQRILREGTASLQAAIDALRQGPVTQGRPMTTPSNGENSVAQKLDKIAAAQRKPGRAPATFSSSRASPLPSPPRPRARAPERIATAELARETDVQEALPLGTQAEDMRPPLERSDFIRALNFPQTAEDKAGFGALRRAMKDRTTAQLIQAAQDVLTLLSEDGIYMDDLRPDMARPEIWRSFAGGARGRAIAALGGIRDRSSLALAAARMKNDPIFRDAAHHFLRRFDQMFSSFADEASDSDISDLSDTRTARAFMLLGRVAGTFD